MNNYLALKNAADDLDSYSRDKDRDRNKIKERIFAALDCICSYLDSEYYVAKELTIINQE